MRDAVGAKAAKEVCFRFAYQSNCAGAARQRTLDASQASALEGVKLALQPPGMRRVVEELLAVHVAQVDDCPRCGCAGSIEILHHARAKHYDGVEPAIASPRANGAL